MLPIFLLIGSNIFMTVAWYGHLKFKDHSIWIVIAVSWMIALPEYLLQVPANRLGTNTFSATQMKIFQEVISVTIFILFGYFYLRESPTWRTGGAFLLILLAAGLAASDHKKPLIVELENPQQIAAK
ncbi:DMT family protein [Telmatocola sphagniphila]|uniref:DMT family protein n=1 Tax=Telmatocola sphagniphila TaxID=1123043 RepID=A0A8E6B851_9BACT|nr:DMT family protein [Telmatocola sphagniphila]QVL32886.1 DMT family protein [Telmatocola sphagniphila]